MGKVSNIFIPKSGKPTPAQSIQLALAFVGEHKDLFEEWIKEKGGAIKDD